MKKTVKTVLLLFVAIIFFDRLISFLIVYSENNLFDRGLMEKPLRQYLKGKSFNTIIMGTSRAYEGINPPELKDVKGMRIFKSAFVGHGPKYNYFFYKMYKRIAGAPKYLIYGVDYFLYSIRTPIGSLADISVDEPQKYKIDLWSPSLLLLDNKKKNDVFFNDISDLLKSNQANLRKKFIEKLQTHIGLEKKKQEHLRIITRKMVKGKFKKHIFFPPPGVEGNYFFKLLDMLKRDKVNVIFVLIPEYIGTFKTNAFRRSFLRHLGEVEDRYGNIRVINLNRPGKFPLKNEEYFIDGGFGKGNSHLSMEGAVLFNRMLSRELNRYLKSLKEKED